LSGARRKVMVVPLRMASDWEVLVLRRPPSKGSVWAPVTGNLDEGERDKEAASRELEEETGLGRLSALHEVGHTNRFEKEVHGALVRFEETLWAAVVPLGAPVALSPEHVDFRWVAGAQAVEMVAHDGCKEGVRLALAAVEKRLR